MSSMQNISRKSTSPVSAQFLADQDIDSISFIHDALLKGIENYAESHRLAKI